MWDCDSVPALTRLSMRTGSGRSERGGAVGGDDGEVTIVVGRFEGLGGVSTPISGRNAVVADAEISRVFSLSLMALESPRGREAAI